MIIREGSAVLIALADDDEPIWAEGKVLAGLRTKRGRFVRSFNLDKFPAGVAQMVVRVQITCGVVHTIVVRQGGAPTREADGLKLPPRAAERGERDG